MLPIAMERRVVLIATLLALINCTVAFRILSKTPERSATPLDLNSFVLTDITTGEGAYKDALDILSCVQSEPSCNRVATSTLLESCHDIDGTSKASEAQIDELRSIYASQLALCEINEAGASIPQSCRSFATADLKQPSKGFRSSKKQLGACLQDLEARPQYWTSYSNSRQNAVTLCKAVRADIDRDNLISLHGKMVETQMQTHSTLSKAALMSSEGLKALQKDFDQARRDLQNNLHKDLEATTGKASSYISRLAQSLASVVENSMTRVTAASSATESQIAHLAHNIGRASEAAAETEDKVNNVLRTIVVGSSELANVQRSQWEVSRTAAADLSTSLQHIQDGQMSSIVQLITNLGLRLDDSNQLISRMYDKQTNMDERMSSLGNSLEHLESKADAIGVAQTRQADSQARLHQQMEVDMQVAQGYLADVTSSATQLQSTVIDTSTKIQSMARFARLFGTVFDWTILTLAIITILLVAWAVRAVWRFNRFAGLTLMVLTVVMIIRDLAFFFTQQKITSTLVSRLAFVNTVSTDGFVCASLVLFMLGAGIGCYSSRLLEVKAWSFHLPHLPFYTAMRLGTDDNPI